MLLSVVVPVYKEEDTISGFLSKVEPILAGITDDYEIIFSLDPSPDRSLDIILENRAKDDRIKVLLFSRRFGQPMATLAGLQYSTGDAVIVMDVDLQVLPNFSPGGREMARRLRRDPTATPTENRRTVDQNADRRNGL